MMTAVDDAGAAGTRRQPDNRTFRLLGLPVLAALTGIVAGFITRTMLLESACAPRQDRTLGKMAAGGYVTASDHTSLLDVLARMRLSGAEVALVQQDEAGAVLGRVEGVITKQQIADSLADVTELFPG